MNKMHDKLMKLMLSKKKEGKSMSDSEQKAKMEALHGMKEMASEMMSDRLKGLKKVTVASNSPEGLDAGLKKAQELVESEDEDEPAKKAEIPEEMKSEEDLKREANGDMHIEEILKMYNWDNPEKIDELIAQLQQKKQELLQS